MMRFSYAIISMVIFLCSCKSQKQEMEIRYTSLNDYDANYIFNLQNNTEALKKIHEFAKEEIKAQKHFVDSLKASNYMDSLPKTYKDHQYGTSLSLTASDISLYVPPKSMDRVQDEEMVIRYELDEENFTIKNIDIGNKYHSQTYDIKETNKTDQCLLQISTGELTLDVLYQIFEKIHKIQYHRQKDLFTYQVFDSKNNHVLDITYKDKGTSLLLNYI